MAKPRPLVAIVDDDQRVLESLEELLESAGHAVRSFGSAQSLLASDAVPEIACVVTDIGMPGMDGFELRRVIGERRPEVPVILITGRHEIVDLAPTRPGLFFRKPFDGQALLAAIGDVLERRGDRS